MATQIRNTLDRLTFGRPVVPSQILLRAAPRPATAMVGRFLLAAIFVISGIAKLADPQGSMGYMTSAGIPAAGILLYVAAFAEIAGGLSIITGFLSRIGSLGLIVFLVITTLTFHHFWTLTGPDRQMQMVNFFKNLGLIGGLLFLVADGPGRYSMDAALRHREP